MAVHPDSTRWTWAVFPVRRKRTPLPTCFPGPGRTADPEPEPAGPRQANAPPAPAGVGGASRPAGPGGPGAVLPNTTAKESLASGRRSRENADELANSGRCVLVRGLVLRDDVRRNAPALIDLVTALLRPRPDLSTALTARA